MIEPVSPSLTCGVTHALRLDTLHPVMQGNKLFKLLAHLDCWQASGRTGLVTPGGCWSNHLHAVAWCGAQLGIRTTGLVRGYEQLPLTDTLRDCRDWGMELVFLDKQSYRRRYDADFQRYWAEQSQSYFVAEGGGFAIDSNPQLRTPKCFQQAIQQLIEPFSQYEQIWLAAGSGTFVKALLVAASKFAPAGRLSWQLVNTVADQGQLKEHLKRTFPDQSIEVHESPLGRFGGGARKRQVMELLAAADAVGLPLDPVYGAPLLMALQQAVTDSGRPEAKRLMIHGGGLQGRRGMGLDYVGINPGDCVSAASDH